MDPVTWIIIAQAVFGVAVSGLNAWLDPQIAQEISNLTNSLKKNTDMRSKLYNAWAEGKADKLQSIMNSSPYGSAAKKISASIELDKDAYNKLDKTLESIDNKLTSQLNDYQSKSNNFWHKLKMFGDKITGGKVVDKETGKSMSMTEWNLKNDLSNKYALTPEEKELQARLDKGEYSGAIKSQSQIEAGAKDPNTQMAESPLIKTQAVTKGLN